MFLGMYLPRFDLEDSTVPQLTLYLDETAESLVEQAVAAYGVSKSRWVADLIGKYAAQEWSRDCLELAGRFPDFPMRSFAET